MLNCDLCLLKHCLRDLICGLLISNSDLYLLNCCLCILNRDLCLLNYELSILNYDLYLLNCVLSLFGLNFPSQILSLCMLNLILLLAKVDV